MSSKLSEAFIRLGCIEDELERARTHLATKNKGGQQVGYFGWTMVPSTINALTRELRWLREAMEAEAVENARLQRCAIRLAEDAIIAVSESDDDMPADKWRCNGCMRIEWRGTPIVHAHYCNAAIILNLDRDEK